jgi:hypothetical protein
MSEANYFAALLHSEDVGALRLINADRDLSPAWRKVYDWITAFHRDNGRLPKPHTVGGTWSLALPRPPEEAEIYAKNIRTNVKRARLEQELSDGVVPHLAGHKPDEAMAAAAEALSRVRSEFPEPDDARSFLSSMSSNVGDRIRAYEFRAANRGNLGLPLPWPTITRMTQGMRPSELWMLAARPNVGKSWMAIATAVFLWQSGYRVLFCSMETPPQGVKAKNKRARERLGEWADVTPQRLTQRIDSIAARVSAWRFLNAQLNPYEQQQLQEYYAACRNPDAYGWGDLRIVSSPRVRTIGQLEQEALEYEPDLVIWDSAYLAISRGRGHGKRTDMAGYFLEDTKHTFERLGIPCLLTWHLSRNVDEDDIEASMNDIALTDDAGRLIDVIMFMFRTPEMVDAGEALFRSGKVRDGVNIPEIRSHFEVRRHIDFSEISFGLTAENTSGR